MYYLHVKLLVMTQPDGYNDLLHAFICSKLGGLRLHFPLNLHMELSYQKATHREKMKCANMKSGNRD